MKRFLGFFVLLIVFIGWVYVFIHREKLFHQVVQFSINQASKDLFDNTIRVERIALARDFKIKLEGISGNLKTAEQPVKIKIGDVSSEDSLLQLLKPGGVRFKFTNASFDESKFGGAHGRFQVQIKKPFSFQFHMVVDGIGLDELVWINPESLAGATGKLVGSMVLKSEGKELSLQGKLMVEPPGGFIQARLFSALLTYLPPSAAKPNVKTLVQSETTVRYEEASLDIKTEKSDLIKMILFIAIPDYNLRLNTNVDVTIDAKNAWFQIADIFGLIQGNQK